MSYLSRLFGYHVTCWSIWLLCELGYTVYLVCRTCLLYGAYHWSVRIYSVKHLICALSDCAALSLISILMPLFVGFIQCQIQASWSCHAAVCIGSHNRMVLKWLLSLFQAMMHLWLLLVSMRTSTAQILTLYSVMPLVCMICSVEGCWLLVRCIYLV